jgi:hypothetical protein
MPKGKKRMSKRRTGTRRSRGGNMYGQVFTENVTVKLNMSSTADFFRMTFALLAPTFAPSGRSARPIHHRIVFPPVNQDGVTVQVIYADPATGAPVPTSFGKILSNNKPTTISFSVPVSVSRFYNSAVTTPMFNLVFNFPKPDTTTYLGIIVSKFLVVPAFLPQETPLLVGTKPTSFDFLSAVNISDQ